MYRNIKIKSNASLTVREMRENSTKQRKRNILYLVLNFLQNEGFNQTADSLKNEAHLIEDYKLCDNVDLEIIFQEYCNYFYLKYDKQPFVCKKIENSSTSPIVQSKSGKSVQHNNATGNKEPEESSPQESIEQSITVNKLLCQDENKELLNNDYEGGQKDLHEFLSGIQKEYKGFIEDIHLRSKLNDDVKWENIIGLDTAKELLREASIYPLKYPDLFCGLAMPWKSILLYGPPGGGKTMLARALAHESDRYFLNVTASSIVSKWRGETEKNIKMIFDYARFRAPSVIFIDEIEALASKRGCPMEHEASRRMKTEILIELDGINKNSDNILFLVTSNLPWDIDSALLRRLEKRIYIPLPGFELRMDIFKNFLSDIRSEGPVDFYKLARMTEGYSGSDIRNVCRDVCMLNVRKSINTLKGMYSNHQWKVNQEDIEESLAKIKPSSDYNTKKYMEWSKRNGAE